MRNIRVSKLLLDNFMSNIKEGDATRCIGTSTGLALGVISMAMLNPGNEISVKDNRNTIVANRELLRLVSDLISKMELRFFLINSSNNTIVYTPYVNIEIYD